MTSNTTPQGTAKASSVYNPSYDAWKAFSKTTESDKYLECWETTSKSPAWLSYEFQSPTMVAIYTIQAINGDNNLNRMPKDWTFEASMDELTWDILDSQQDQMNWSKNETRAFTIPFDKRKEYKIYRINIQSNNGGDYILINNLEMLNDDAVLIKLNKLKEDKISQYGSSKISDFDFKMDIHQIHSFTFNSTKISKMVIFQHEVNLKKYNIKKMIL
ncbi:discoidin domain-containing protein [Paenibacillus alvei]|uniref:discoidin domain-containing protein n=1 Tax=Paenibacillus alvei TaxID=44250 RepID=UPI00041991B3|nr:discoidin domain-containing protein [Paenibacillus alvei]